MLKKINSNSKRFGYCKIVSYIHIMIKLTDKSDPIKSIESYGFIKTRNREEYLGIIPILTEFGYS